MGLTEEQFWNLTLAQFDALVKRKLLEKEWQDFRAGLICSTMVNLLKDPKKRKRYTPEDFMPGKKKTNTGKNWRKQLALVEILNVAFGGKDERKKK